jgi:hypothetical protein
VEAREQAWDRQIEADAEAGKFDQLAEEALRDYREGKCIRLPVKFGSTLSPKFFDTYQHLPPGIRAKASETTDYCCRPGKRQIQGDQTAWRRQSALLAPTSGSNCRRWV